MINYLMRSGSRRIAVLLASTVLAGPARPIAAWAEPKPASAKDQKMASDLVKKAIGRAEAGDHTGAIKLYNDAYLLVPNVLLLPSIGAQYQELGQWEDALEYFCRYLKEDPSGTNAPYARSQAKRMQRELGRKSIDSRDPCATPPDRKTPPDEPPGPESPVKTGESHTPPVKAGGNPGVPQEEPPLPPKPPSGNSAVMYTGLAAGIAGIAAGGIGIYYGVQGKNISDQINSHKPNEPWPDGIQNLMNAGERDNRLQLSYLVASGVLVTAGVVLYVVGRPDAASEHTSDKTAIHVTPTANGLAAFGRF
jgi:tetratricopeptide (TPR) repeat protein